MEHRRLAGWLFVLVATASASRADVMRIHFIDVNQGAATLVELPCGAVLIDTGGERWPDDTSQPARYDSTEALATYLDAFFDGRPDLDRRLDALYLTHPHLDHTRGVPLVLKRYRPRNVVYNGQGSGSGWAGQQAAAAWAKKNGRRYYVQAADAVAAGGLTNSIIDPLQCEGTDPEFHVLWGWVRDGKGWWHQDFQDENNHSLVIRIDYGDASVLIMGDLEEHRARKGRAAGIERLLASYPTTGGPLDADVLHVAHHGSHNGNSSALVERVSPDIAVIASGPACWRSGYSAWSHAHPRKETLDELLPGISGTRASVSIPYFRKHDAPREKLSTTKALYGTGWDGTVVLESGADGNWRLASRSGPHPCVLP